MVAHSHAPESDRGHLQTRAQHSLVHEYTLSLLLFASVITLLGRDFKLTRNEGTDLMAPCDEAYLY